MKKPFWAVEVEVIARPVTKTHVQELKRITDFLVSQFKLQDTKKSTYERSIEKAVLVRPDETRLQRTAQLCRLGWVSFFHQTLKELENNRRGDRNETE